MPNCITTGHQLTINWVNIIFIFTHCQHSTKFRIQHSILYLDPSPSLLRHFWNLYVTVSIAPFMNEDKVLGGRTL